MLIGPPDPHSHLDAVKLLVIDDLGPDDCVTMGIEQLLIRASRVIGLSSGCA